MSNLLTKSQFLGAVRAIELLLLSAGLIYTIMPIFKGSFGSVITIFCGWLSSYSYSTSYICIFVHLVILLIAVSSLLHRSDDGCVESFQVCDLVSDFSSSMSPINLETHPGEMKVEDIEAVATETTSLENRESDAVLLDEFSGLSRAEEIKEAQITEAGGRFRDVEVDVSIQADTREELEGDDSMEATWGVIMKRTKAQEKQLMKSETWPKAETTLDTGLDHSEDGEMRKSLTLTDAITIIQCKGGLRRDSSTNLDELNQRFEAFIQKTNSQIRLQRLESQQRYLALMSRGLA